MHQSTHMQDTIRHIKESLKGLYPPEEIGSFIRLIFEKVCRYSTVDFILCKNKTLSPTQHHQIIAIVKRLQKYEPIQYILGETWFYGLRLKTAPGALIPRPETEELADLIIKRHKNDIGRLVDIGTGSGCLAIALALNMPGIKTEGWDISTNALKIAQENALSSNAPIKFRQVNILEYSPSPDEYGKYDIWVSNPPYVRECEKNEMKDNVLKYEPYQALFVPDNDPLLFYRKIGTTALDTVKPGGNLYFEINANLGNETVNLLAGLGYRNIELLKDMQQRDRIVSAILP